MKSSMRAIPSIFIVGFWVVMMGLLVRKEFIPMAVPPQKIVFPVELPYIKNWGIYSKTDRIGNLKTEFTKSPAGFLWKNLVNVRLLGDSKVFIDTITRFNPSKKLNSFQMGLKYETLTIDIEGKVIGDVLKLTIKDNGRETNYDLPWLINTDIMSNTLIPWFYIPNVTVGDKFQWYLLNPLTQKRDLVKAVVRRTTFYYNKKDFISVLAVDVYYQDMKMEFWIDDSGNPLKIITPWGWGLEAE